MYAKSERSFSLHPLCLCLLFILPILVPACAKEGPNTPEPIRSWLRARYSLMNEASRMDPDRLMSIMDRGDANHRLAVFYTIREMGPTEGLKPLGVQSPYSECCDYRMYYWSLIRYWGADAVPGLIAMMGPEPLEPSGNPELGNPRIACELLSALGSDASDAVTPLTEHLQKDFTVESGWYSPIDALAYIDVWSDRIINYGIDVLDGLHAGPYDYGYRQDSVCYMLGKLADPSDQSVIDKIKQYLDQTLAPKVLGGPSYYYKDSDAARAGLYMLGVDQDEMLQGIVDNSDTYALLRIGDRRAVHAYRDLLSSPTADLTLRNEYSELEELCLIGPRRDVLAFIIDKLENREASPDYLLLDLISSFGPDAIDTLPTLLEWYEKVKAEEPGNSESTNRYRLLPLETAIIRVSEGTYWQVDE